MANENETLRWPTNLDRDAIVHRLVQIRDSDQVGGLPELMSLFTNVEGMPASQIGAAVIAAINMVQENPEYDAIATQLSMVAMNLKNLK